MRPKTSRRCPSPRPPMAPDAPAPDDARCARHGRNRRGRDHARQRARRLARLTSSLPPNSPQHPRSTPRPRRSSKRSSLRRRRPRPTAATRPPRRPRQPRRPRTSQRAPRHRRSPHRSRRRHRPHLHRPHLHRPRPCPTGRNRCPSTWRRPAPRHASQRESRPPRGSTRLRRRCARRSLRTSTSAPTSSPGTSSRTLRLPVRRRHGRLHRTCRDRRRRSTRPRRDTRRRRFAARCRGVASGRIPTALAAHVDQVDLPRLRRPRDGERVVEHQLVDRHDGQSAVRHRRQPLDVLRRRTNPHHRDLATSRRRLRPVRRERHHRRPGRRRSASQFHR